MRVLLDAHVSSRRIGGPLAAAGHDVLGLDRDEMLSRLVDEDVLALATEQARVVVTHNVRHFAPIARRWIEAGRSHGGLILVTFANDAYGPILRGLEAALGARPAPERWVDRVEFLTPPR